MREGNKEEETLEEWTRLHIRLQTTPGVSSSSGGKKKKKGTSEE